MKTGTVELDGPVFYVEHAGPAAASTPPLVLVHGLGGAHLNWACVAPRLSRHARVVALDLPGFGRSPLGGRSAELAAQRALLSRFLGEVVGEPAILVGNSMGGVLSLWQAAEEPDSVAGLILVCPAQPVQLGARIDPQVAARFLLQWVPFLGERLLERERAKQGPEGLVRSMLELCCVDASRVAKDVHEAHVALAHDRARDMPWSLPALIQASRSLTRHLFNRKLYREHVQRVRARTLLIQGVRDRLVQASASRALGVARPDWTVHLLEDVGHVPMMEAPETFLSLVDSWLEKGDVGVGQAR